MTKPDGINLLTDTASLQGINGEPSANTTVKKSRIWSDTAKTSLPEVHSACLPLLPAKAATPLHVAMHQALRTALMIPHPANSRKTWEQDC